MMALIVLLSSWFGCIVGIAYCFVFFSYPFLVPFTEHMLFYASKKYPIEDSYSKYIAEVCLVLPA